jgi:drug/metabolite transporter (DMT)-like permease
MIKQRNTLAVFSLFTVAAVWGAAFVLMKDAIEKQPFLDFLATRFIIAAAVMIAVKPGVLKAFNRHLVSRGLILGFLLSAAYITQTIGLELSTAAISGFLTGLYVVFTPLLAWLVSRAKVSPRIALGVILATFGLAFISYNGASIEVSHIWLIVCALLFAAHIVGLSIYSPSQDPYALTVIQLVVVGIVCLVPAVADGYQAPSDFSVWFAVLFTALFSTALAFFVQTWVQGIMDASRVSIILITEVLFTALLAVAIGQEQLELKTIFGGALMLAAMVWVEWPTKGKTTYTEPLPH